MIRKVNPIAKHMNSYNKPSTVPNKKRDNLPQEVELLDEDFDSFEDELDTLIDNEWRKLNDEHFSNT